MKPCLRLSRVRRSTYLDHPFDIITGEEKLILMTSTFEVISEAPLETVDFGEGLSILILEIGGLYICT